MYVGPQKGQVPGQVAVAPADVVEVLHRGDAPGLKPGDYKSGSAPKVHGPDPGGLEPVDAADHRHPALQPDDLRHVIEKADPEIVIPMHTDAPERMQTLCQNRKVILLKDREELLL